MSRRSGTRIFGSSARTDRAPTEGVKAMHVMTRTEWPLLQALVFLCAGLLHVRTPAPSVGLARPGSPPPSRGPGCPAQLPAESRRRSPQPARQAYPGRGEPCPPSQGELPDAGFPPRRCIRDDSRAMSTCLQVRHVRRRGEPCPLSRGRNSQTRSPRAVATRHQQGKQAGTRCSEPGPGCSRRLHPELERTGRTTGPPPGPTRKSGRGISRPTDRPTGRQQRSGHCLNTGRAFRVPVAEAKLKHGTVKAPHRVLTGRPTPRMRHPRTVGAAARPARGRTAPGAKAARGLRGRSRHRRRPSTSPHTARHSDGNTVADGLQAPAAPVTAGHPQVRSPAPGHVGKYPGGEGDHGEGDLCGAGQGRRAHHRRPGSRARRTALTARSTTEPGCTPASVRRRRPNGGGSVKRTNGATGVVEATGGLRRGGCRR